MSRDQAINGAVQKIRIDVISAAALSENELLVPVLAELIQLLGPDQCIANTAEDVANRILNSQSEP